MVASLNRPKAHRQSGHEPGLWRHVSNVPDERASKQRPKHHQERRHVVNVPPHERTMQPPQIIRRRNLPHWDVPTAAYFVTACLDGSIPGRGLLDSQSYRADLDQRSRPEDQGEEEWAVTRWKRSFARTDLWLDRAEGTRLLADDRLAQIVVDALCFFAGERYDLLGYVVMPSHLHWVFQPLERWLSTLKA